MCCIVPITSWRLFQAQTSQNGDRPAFSLPQGVAGAENTNGLGLVHEYLLAEGCIEEPLEGLNCFECDWVAGEKWRFVAEFAASEEVLSAECIDLVFEAIDGKAAIFVNGECVGEHRSAYHPFEASVGGKLKRGVNRVEVLLSTGLEDFTEADAVSPDGVSFATEESLGFRLQRGDLRRIFLRKPAFTFGWDWCPRVISIGIPGAVYLRASRQARIDRVVTSTLAANEATANLEAAVELRGLHYYSSDYSLLECKIQGPDGNVVAEVQRRILPRSGLNVFDFLFSIERPRLWWPRGYGEQPLYQITASLYSQSGELIDRSTDSFGIRTIRLNDCDRFTFEINGRPVFCQGANWVPPDVIYTRPTDADYVRLIEAAAEGNMNMLRVWGGGNYEREIFYSTCDRLGLLVWQDFMFACSPYPDHLDWFRREVEKEAEYQVRRLANHPCLALWCGSNENSWAFQEWWKDQTHRGARIYNEILPKAVHLHAPKIPYWNGSPYGGKTPNQTGIGNNHFWKDVGAYLAPKLQDRLDLGGHDRYESFFISEYGVHGPCCLESTRQYLGTDQIDRSSQNWLHHTNTRRYEETLQGAVERVYGYDAAALSLEDYLYFGGLWQGMAAAYAFDAARFKSTCSGSLIWMFNEAWGEAGWGLVDYYQRKKIAWHFVRRALAPQRLILRREGDDLVVRAFCEQPLELSFRFAIGYSLLDGREVVLDQAACRLRPLQTEIARTRIPHDLEPGGVFFARSDGDWPIETGVLWPGCFRSLTIPKGKPSIVVLEEKPGRMDVLVEGETYLHGVYFAAGATLDCSDNYFDMLPGDNRQVTLVYPASERNHIQVGWIHGDCLHQRVLLNQLLASRPLPQPSPVS